MLNTATAVGLPDLILHHQSNFFGFLTIVRMAGAVACEHQHDELICGIEMSDHHRGREHTGFNSTHE
jgi:hypothetical protein